jgi:hypothetical protein
MSRRTRRNSANMPVMKRQCATCPFRTDERGQYDDPRLVSKIQHQCLNQASQICHHPSLEGKPETHLCRGARDFQLTIFYRMGIIDAPTDEAWSRRVDNTTKRKI